MAALLFDDDGEFRGPSDTCGDLLFVQTMRLETSWRGYGIGARRPYGDQTDVAGLLALDGLISSLPAFTMSSVIMSPSGMTQDAPAGFDTDAALRLRHVKDSASRLKRYYGLLGFKDYKAKHAAKDSMECIGLWTGYVLPRIETVVPHLF